MKANELANQRFGRLLVIERAGKDKQQNWMWRCLCDCGREHTVRGMSLKCGGTTSCGCFHSEIQGHLAAERQRTHGMSATRIYTSWKQMINRCHNPKAPRFAEWGGRGIRVCERWRRFENFLADMGEKPEGRSLDRIDNDGDYTPENCRWATPAEQQRNRNSGLHLLTVGGRTQCITDWAVETGVPRTVIYQRINHLHWPVEKAITTPVANKFSPIRKVFLEPKY